MRETVIIPEDDIEDAVLQFLEEISRGAKAARDQGIQVLFDEKIDFEFVVLRTANALETTTEEVLPDIVSTRALSNPDVATVVVDELPDRVTETSDENPEDLTTTEDTNPQVITETVDNQPEIITTSEDIEQGYTQTETNEVGAQSNETTKTVPSITTVSSKAGGDETDTTKEYDEFEYTN